LLNFFINFLIELAVFNVKNNKRSARYLSGVTGAFNFAKAFLFEAGKFLSIESFRFFLFSLAF
jgi:hypothetical protein